LRLALMVKRFLRLHQGVQKCDGTNIWSLPSPATSKISMPTLNGQRKTLFLIKKLTVLLSNT